MQVRARVRAQHAAETDLSTPGIAPPPEMATPRRQRVASMTVEMTPTETATSERIWREGSQGLSGWSGGGATEGSGVGAAGGKPAASPAWPGATTERGWAVTGRSDLS